MVRPDMTEHQLLGGKVAIVTGGAAGIGEAVSRLFGEMGAKVVVLDKDSEPAHKVSTEIQAAGGSSICTAADVRDPSALRAAVDVVKRGEPALIDVVTQPR